MYVCIMHRCSTINHFKGVLLCWRIYSPSCHRPNASNYKTLASLQFKQAISTKGLLGAEMHLNRCQTGEIILEEEKTEL